MASPKLSTLAIAFSLVFVATKSRIDAAEKVKFAYAAPSVNVSMLWITKEAKLFERNGIDAEVLFLDPSLVQKAMITGEVQLAMMTGGLMAPPKLAGVDLVMLAGFVNKYVFRLVVRPEINSPLHLKGKRAGISPLGSAADRGLRLLLMKWGLNPEKDMVFLQMGGGGEPARIAGLIANSIDATLINPPSHKKAVEAGMKILTNMEDMDIHLQHIGLVSSQRWQSKNLDAARRIMKSFVDGIHVMRTNPAVAKRALGKYIKITNDAELDETYQLLKKLIAIKPYPTHEGFRAVFDELGAKIPAAKSADPKDFMDTSLLEALDKSGYIDNLYR
jgi:ABC-type nitrate/sulfonate/bicarbonate transport system substrate-binding protein